MMKTIRRDWLKRRVLEGKVIGRCSYHYTDDYAWDAANDFGSTEWMPVVIVDANPKERVIMLSDWDFKSSTGMAYWNDNGFITFKVHGNLSYEMQITESKR